MAAPLASPLLATLADAAQAGAAIPPRILERIGITTVCFRDRFVETRTKGAGPFPEGDLTLLTAPKFIVDRLGLRNVEVWSAQFPDRSLDYCRRVKQAAADAGARIINIQVDGPENLSDPETKKRTDGIAQIKAWMDRSAACGATLCRANTGGGPEPAWDVKRTADSFRQLAEYGQTIGVTVLVENHIGYSADIDKVVAVVEAVNHPYCRTLSDWGNTPTSSPQARVDGLKKLFPRLALVSAKQLNFDDRNQHEDYDVVPLIEATEASGYRGIYSIEFYGDRPPRDAVAAAETLKRTIAARIKPA